MKTESQLYVVEVSKCPTCNGTGCAHSYDSMHVLSAGQHSCCTNPDCVSGRVTQQGTIERRCTEHVWHDHLGGVPPSTRCKMRLVLVVPLEETQ